MAKKLLKVFLAIAAFHWTVDAQSMQDSLSTRLGIIAANLDVAGMSVVVVKKDKIIYSKGFGKRNIAKNLPVDSTTIYRIASVSKSFVAVAVMQLCDQGKMKLTDDIGTLLGYTVRNPRYPNDPITVAMLLSHVSSLTDNDGYSSITSLRSAAAFANVKPGSYFQYCNLGFSTLGAIVEKISTQRFDLYIRSNILTPLGMAASYNIDDFTADQFANIAALYRKTGVTWTPQADDYNGVKPAPRDLSHYTIGEDAFTFSPTGGVRTSAEDLAKFMMAHMNKGVYNGTRILSEASVLSMHAPKWVFNGSNGANEGFWNKYGYAFHTAEALIPGQLLCGVPGEAYGLLSDMYFSPDSLYGIVFITNGGGKFAAEANGFYNIENAVMNAVYTILLYPPHPSTTDKLLNENFENGVPPQGWKSLNLDGSESSAWLNRTTGRPSNSAAITTTAKIGYTESGILVTKKVFIADTGRYLSYEYRKFCGSQYSSRMDVLVSQGTVQTDLASFKGIRTYTRTNGRPAYSGSDAKPSEWQTETLDLSAFVNKDVFIAFKVDNTYDDGSGAANTGDIWDLDNITLVKSPAITDVKKNSAMQPSFSLRQNYPNPFNPTTSIRFTVQATGKAILKIYDVLGKDVATLFDDIAEAGRDTQVQFNASGLATGLYLSRLESDGRVQCKKMLLLK